MVENIPFYHALANVVIDEQGYGIDALGTLFFIFGISSLLVGAVFYTLGKLEYGSVVYYFPSHVLVGCIGGIGVFIIVTAMEVTLDMTFSFDAQSFATLVSHLPQVSLVILFEATLRILEYVTLDSTGRPRFPLLSPVYFCLLTPLFYLGLWILDIPILKAEEEGFFFPGSENTCGSETCSGWSTIWNEDIAAIWSVIDFSTISWTAVGKCIPTMIALTAFSLIHVPINIPAFAISTDVDTDMNAELIAHGWSNAISGAVFGLQNYMTYSNSVLYAKSGGTGKISSLTIAGLTCVLFVIGPQINAYIPRCLAGTLLLHIGVDLFVEGVKDSYGKYDYIEYAFIWIILIMMTVYGMTAALITGVIAALTTYAAQSIVHLNPIKRVITASTLRSSAWVRCKEAVKILNDPHVGRNRILIVQLQSHLFFGNMVTITNFIKTLLQRKKGTPEEPYVVIFDFTLVCGMDSSAAHAIAKLKKEMHKSFNVEVLIFVTGRGDGFPCEYALSKELCKGWEACEVTEGEAKEWNEEDDVSSSVLSRGSISISQPTFDNNLSLIHPSEQVCENLDMALIFAEDMLVARSNPMIFRDTFSESVCADDPSIGMSREKERKRAAKYLINICPNADETEVIRLFSYFEREEYQKDGVIWKQGSASTSAKLLINGTVESLLEGTSTTETVLSGNMFGELGLVNGIDRLSTVVCVSATVVLYSLSRESWNVLIKEEPRIARLVDEIVIEYLAHRVQHVSNRVLETRCLPI
mmetsp:Transcript_29741/g.45337  ORF Transcript_29741/g.45337 Transcript_29741/m.45337 type:complete len:754 (-) Transcript_29741:1325-3586(-)